MTGLHIYVNFPGTTEEAFNFYRSIFGGEFSSMFRMKDIPIEGLELTEAEKERIMHIGLRIGGTRLMATDTLESLGQKIENGNNVYLFLSPESREEADRLFAALAEGGTVETPMGDQAWGDYYGALRDKYGVQWMVNYEASGEG
jgi:PhnB protein